MNFLTRLIFISILVFSNLSLARPKYEKINLKIGNKVIKVELAKSDKQRSHGLMHISKLPEGVDGMLFEFPFEQQLSFWMKNTFIDLSIAFLNSNLKIIDIQKMKATSMMTLESSLVHYKSRGQAKYALEVPVNWFEKNKIKLGTKLKILK